MSAGPWPGESSLTTVCFRFNFHFCDLDLCTFIFSECKSLAVFCRTGVNKFCGFNKQAIKRDYAGKLARTTWLPLVGRKAGEMCQTWLLPGLLREWWHHCWRQSVQREGRAVSDRLEFNSVHFQSELSETFRRNLWCLRIWNSNPRDSRLLKIRLGPEFRDDSPGFREAQGATNGIWAVISM